MQTDGRFIKHKDRVGLRSSHFAGELQTLRFAAGQARRLLSQRQVAQTEIVQNFQTLMDHLQIPAELHCMSDVHIHQFRQSRRFSRTGGIRNLIGRTGVAGTAALRTGDVHVRKKLDVESDLAGAVAARTAQSAGVVGEIARLVPEFPGFRSPCKNFAQFVVDIGVGRHGRADIDSDRRCVDQFHLPDSLRLHRKDVVRKRTTLNDGLKTRNETFQNQGRLP